jgi:hypothetical protein
LEKKCYRVWLEGRGGGLECGQRGVDRFMDYGVKGGSWCYPKKN